MQFVCFQSSATDQGGAEDRAGNPPRAAAGRAGRRRDARAARLPVRHPHRGA